MKINNIQNSSQCFGVHLDTLGKKLVEEKERQVIKGFSEKSCQYRQFFREKREIDRLFPDLYLWTQTTPVHIGTIGLVKASGEYYAGIAINDIDFDVLYGFLKYIHEGDKRHSYVWGCTGKQNPMPSEKNHSTSKKTKKLKTSKHPHKAKCTFARFLPS